MGTVAALAPTRLIAPAAFCVFAVVLGGLAGLNPALAISGALAFAFMLVIFADLYIGVVLFTLLSFVAQVPGLGGSDVTFAKLVGLLLAVSWLAVLTTRPDARADLARAYPAAAYTLIVFLAWVALSQLWATDSAAVLDALFRLSLNALLVFIVFTAVRTPRHAIGVVAAFVIGATVAAVYGLLFVSPEGADGAERLAGGLDNPNELATVLVAALALSIGLGRALGSFPLARFCAFAAGAVCTAGIFLTGSRGGLVALAVALIAFLVIGTRFRGRLLLIVIFVALAGVGYYSYVASPEERERVIDVSSGGTGRTDLWEVGWRMVEDKPVQGVGAGNFIVESPRYLLEPGTIQRTDVFIGEAPRVTHNTYLQMWSELGTVGLLLFLSIMAFGLGTAFKAARSFADSGDAQMEPIAVAVFVALAAVLAADFFGSRQYDKELWLLLGLAPALLAIARQRRPAEEP